MYLSKTVQYAFRCFAHLVSLEPGQTVRSKELSEQTGVPRPYLSKVMRQLVVHGLIEAKKGHGGGFRLSKPAAEIRFIDVLDAVGYKLAPDGCIFGKSNCPSEGHCPFHTDWCQLESLFGKWASNTRFG